MLKTTLFHTRTLRILYYKMLILYRDAQLGSHWAYFSLLEATAPIPATLLVVQSALKEANL